MLPIECVVRGYLAAPAGRTTRERRGLRARAAGGAPRVDKLPEPIFTPATKATEGHDENITREQAAELVGEELFRQVEEVSLRLYRTAANHARAAGIIIADTKFEIGLDADGNLVLGDEALTPDSSRFWPGDTYEPGRAQDSSTSSSSATTARRPAGTRRIPARRSGRCRRRDTRRSTSRRSSGSRPSRSRRTSRSDGGAR
jgi:phosphoribosylaminoimidazole-succinocarboxamide synthase